MLKKLIQGSFVSFAVASSLLATDVTIEHGWNLLGTGVNDVNLSATFSAHPDVSIVWGFENNTKNWVAYGNNNSLNQLITDHNITHLEFVPSNMGYWVLNNGSVFNVTLVQNGATATTPPNQNQQSHLKFTFGADTNDTSHSLFVTGTTLFDSWSDGYDKDIIQSATSLQGNEYSYDTSNNSFTNPRTRNITYSIIADNNVIYSMPNGENGYLIINNVKLINSVNGSDISTMGLKYIAITSTVTQQATTFDWQTASWQPTYYSQASNSQLPITDIITLKNHFINPNEGYWQGDQGNRYFFEGSNDMNITSGNLVNAIYQGKDPNCTPTANNDCLRYIRGTTHVGTWSLTNNILSAETDKQINAWRFNSGTFEEGWIAKVGATDQWAWVTGGTDASKASAIEQTIQNSYGN